MSKNKRPSRPTREERSNRALQNVDVANVDPLLVLKLVAADPTQPAAARVSAARALLAARVVDLPSADSRERDDLNRRALTLLARAQRKTTN